MTFAQMKKMEPRLSGLEAMAKTFNRQRCTIAFWYSEVKPLLVHLVGWGRGDKSDPLATEEAYDKAYDHLYNLLPDCTTDSCYECRQNT